VEQGVERSVASIAVELSLGQGWNVMRDFIACSSRRRGDRLGAIPGLRQFI
jgi:hypothetical protein